MSRYYAGVGSRETPPSMLVYFTRLAQFLERDYGYTLRSGGADGADAAFERGAYRQKQIFLPWKGFNASLSLNFRIPAAAFDIAANHHPAWLKLKPAVQCLMARNVQQVLGPDCTSRSDFVVCWTKNASGAGGTGQAIRVARSYGIPVFDFGDQAKAYADLMTFLEAKGAA